MLADGTVGVVLFFSFIVVAICVVIYLALQDNKRYAAKDKLNEQKTNIETPNTNNSSDQPLTAGQKVFWGICVFLVVGLLIAIMSESNPQAATGLGSIVGGVFILVVIAFIVYNIAKTQENTQKQTELLQRENNIRAKVLAQQPQSAGTANSICHCCETVVPSETMQRLKSNQLVCRQCYENFTKQNISIAEKK